MQAILHLIQYNTFIAAVDSHCSSSEVINGGVSHGSVLSPMLYFIFYYLLKRVFYTSTLNSAYHLCSVSG